MSLLKISQVDNNDPNSQTKIYFWPNYNRFFCIIGTIYACLYVTFQNKINCKRNKIIQVKNEHKVDNLYFLLHS